MNTNRLIHIDLLRIFSIFCMMLLHTAATQWSNTPVTSYNWQIFNIYDSFVRFCVPVMIMISGMFFLRPEKIIPFKKLFNVYIIRIVTALIFWLACYTLYMTTLKFSSFNISSINFFLSEFISTYYHLWFCFMIIGLYLITPFMKRIVLDKKIMEYFLLLSFSFSIMIPTLKMIPSSFLQQLLNIPDKLLLYFVLGYTFYFVVGFYIHEYPPSKFQCKLIYIIGVFGILATILMTYIISVNAMKASEIFYGYLTLNVMCVSIAIFVFFENYISILRFNGNINSKIVLISECSFCMYLCHYFFIFIFTRIGLTTTTFNPIFSIPIITILIFICSLSLALFLYKIPFARKHIM